MNSKILILIGISGSGKSTFAKKLCQVDNSYLRINRDDIRKTLVGDLKGYYERRDLNFIEKEISYFEEAMLSSILKLSKNAVIDNTNLSLKYINRWKEFVKDLEVGIEYKFFDIDLNIAKRRVLLRDYNTTWLGTEIKSEGVKYIDKQIKQYEQVKRELLK